MADENIVTSWSVDSSAAQAGFDRVADAAEGAGKRVASGMAAAHVAGNLATAALEKLAGAIKSVSVQALEWQHHMPDDTRQIDSMAKATAGLVSKLELAHAAERMQLEGLQLSGREMDAVSKMAVKLSRVWDIDFGTALDNITGKLAGGGKGLLKLLNQAGLEGKGLADLKDPVGEALDRIEKGFSGVSVEAESAREKLQQMKVSITDMVGELSKSVVQSGAFQQWLNEMKEGFSILTGLIKVATGQVSLFSGAGLSAMEDYAIILKSMGLFAPMGREGRETAADAIMAAVKAIKAAKEAFPLNATINPEMMGNVPWWLDPYAEVPGGGRSRAGGGGKKKTKAEKAWTYKNWGEEQETDYPGLTGMSTLLEGGGGGAFERFMGSPAEQAAIKLEEINALEKKKELYADLIDLEWKLMEAQQASDKTMKDAYKYLEGTGLKVLSTWTAGLWEAADAALMGADSFAGAMAKMTKSLLLNIAKEATVMALMALAKWAMSYFTDAGALKAFGLYSAAAVTAGAMGLAMSASGVGAVSNEKKREETRKEDRYSPNVGQTIRENQQPIYVNVYFGDPTDPAAALLASKQIEIGLRRGGALARA